MHKISTEELAQLKLMKETIREMHAECNDMPMSEVYDVVVWLGYLWTKINIVLVRNGVEPESNRPTLSGAELPF